MNIAAFGEIIWDVFPEKSVIGGAPFNFSAHMSRLGANVSLISAIGNDELGEKASEYIQKYYIKDNYIALSERKTGMCLVSIDTNGNPSYELCDNTAYDFICLSDEKLEQLCSSEYDAFCFGTLAQRHEQSLRTLEYILKNGKFRYVLYDINIRKPWYTREIIEKSLHSCNILKVSREEASVFEEISLVNVRRCNYSDEYKYYVDLCSELTERYNIKMILFTLDKDGASVYTAENHEYLRSDIPKVNLVSAVGGGDSFTACFLNFYLMGKTISECLEKAEILSSYVVQNIEAIPPYTAELQNKLFK